MAERPEISRLHDLATLDVGVDPGMANTALVVLDKEDNPVAAISHSSRAVKVSYTAWHCHVQPVRE